MIRLESEITVASSRTRIGTSGVPARARHIGTVCHATDADAARLDVRVLRGVVVALVQAGNYLLVVRAGLIAQSVRRGRPRPATRCR